MEVFVARQPVFNKKKEVVAYELLYRNSSSNNFNPGTDGDYATSDVIINGLVLIGLDTLVGGKKAFVNFTERLLLEKTPLLLPKELLVIEVLENIEPTDEVIEACRELKSRGYIIALDDFVFHPKYQPLIDLADIIKVDFLNTTEEERKALVRRVAGKKTKLLAEKVETLEDFDQALKFGYSYFQGYFFSKPAILKGTDIPTFQVNYLQLIGEVYGKEPEFDELTGIIEKDISLSYKLLKYINFSGQYLLNRITSIKHALMLLGLEEVKKWLSLILIRGLSKDKPDIIAKMCMIRARLFEEIAPFINMSDRKTELFILGMFSMLDVLTNQPLPVILNELPISEDIKSALLGKPSTFSKVYELILHYEKGNWEQFSEVAQSIDFDVNKIPKIYYNALDWTEDLFELEDV